MLEKTQPAAQLLAHLGVQRPKRFVEQQHARLDGQGARQRDPLALPAGQLGRVAIRQRTQLHQVEKFSDALPNFVDSGALSTGLDPQPEGHVIEHGHVPEQRVMLEHEAHLALAHVGVGGVLAVEKHLTAVGGFQTRNDSQQGGFAAAGRPQQTHQFARGEIQRDSIEGHETAKPFGDVLHSNAHDDAL